jgi:hypothetical protein
MTHTTTYTFVLLPDDINQANGLVIELGKQVAKETVDVFGTELYVFVLAEEKPYHKTIDDRIRLIPFEQLHDEHPQVHILATMLGYTNIRKRFVVVDKADISHLKI